MSAPANPSILKDRLADSIAMLNSTQACVDDGMFLAALVTAEADGKLSRLAVDETPVELARRMLGSKTYPPLTSYLTDDAMRYGKPTRGGVLRALTGWFDR